MKEKRVISHFQTPFLVKFFNSFLIILLGVFVFASNNPLWVSFWIFFFFLLAGWEFYQFSCRVFSASRSLVLFFVGIVAYVFWWVFFVYQGDQHFIGFHQFDVFALVFGLVAILFFVRQFFQEKKNPLLFFLVASFFCLYLPTYFLRVASFPNGLWLFLWVGITVKLVDVGGYLFGTFWGKRVISEKISPKKTWEGLIGGIILSLLGGLFLAEILGEKVGQIHQFSFLFFLLLIFLLSVLSVCGDFFESILKRFVGVKDSGNLIPRMGGSLDMIDSLLFSMPLFYFWLLKFS